MPSLIDVVQEHELSDGQKAFVNTWSREYFGQVAISNELKSASVHWRLFLRQNDIFLSHVGITEFLILIDGHSQFAGAVGGLFTVREEMGNGYGNSLMDATEEFIFDYLAFNSGILFCLSDLIPFYERRGWITVQTPVTLEQPHGIVTWPESVMTLSRDSKASERSIIHVPVQPALRKPIQDN